MGKLFYIYIEEEMYKRFQDRYILEGLVKSDNIASQMLFEKSGYNMQNDATNSCKIYTKIPSLTKWSSPVE